MKLFNWFRPWWANGRHLRIIRNYSFRLTEYILFFLFFFFRVNLFLLLIWPRKEILSKTYISIFAVVETSGLVCLCVCFFFLASFLPFSSQLWEKIFTWLACNLFHWFFWCHFVIKRWTSNAVLRTSEVLKRDDDDDDAKKREKQRIAKSILCRQVFDLIRKILVKLTQNLHIECSSYMQRRLWQEISIKSSFRLMH